MGCNFCYEKTFFNIIQGRKSQMFGWGNHAEEVRTVHPCNCSSDCPGNMVKTRGNIRNKGAQEVERGVITEFFHASDTELDFVQGNVTRAFHKSLDIGSPGSFYKFSECDKFHEFRAVGSIGDTARTHAVSQAQGHVVLFCDFE